MLTTAQSARLKELLVQDLGYESLAIRDVRAQLSLSTDQTAQIKTIVSKLKPTPRSNSATLTKKDANLRLAKLLTAAQDAKLRSLAGRTLGNQG